jgi:hypothetical protein
MACAGALAPSSEFDRRNSASEAKKLCDLPETVGMMPTEDFFFYFGIFNQNSRNEPGQNFFPNMTLFNRAKPVGVTHKGVTPCALTRLDSTVAHNSTRGPSHTI